MALCTFRLEEQSLRFVDNGHSAHVNRASQNGRAAIHLHTPQLYPASLFQTGPLTHPAPASAAGLPEFHLHTRRAWHRRARAAHVLSHSSKH